MSHETPSGAVFHRLTGASRGAGKKMGATVGLRPSELFFVVLGYHFKGFGGPGRCQDSGFWGSVLLRCRTQSLRLSGAQAEKGE